MISRYQNPLLAQIWSEENKFKKYLDVELATARAWVDLGLIPAQDFKMLKKASFDIDDIYRIEQDTKHDVIAFTRAVGLSLGKEKKWIHYGLTSTDVVDTANALLLKEANQAINKAILKFLETLKAKASAYQYVPVMGRTHGVHAEVTSFGLKFALWYNDLKRIYDRFLVAASAVEVGKISGAVGNYSAHTPQLEKLTMNYLKLEAAPISTQTLQRDRHAHYLSVLALIGSQLEKIAIEVRHLSRTEVGEANEFFDIKQKGSSAMPHKKNPISSENITGLARLLRGYMISSYESIALWHERDISHSSVERVILADATTVLEYMLVRYQKTVDQLMVHPDRMLKNINLTNGAIHAQRIVHALIDKGLTREQAYDLVQPKAIAALNGKSFLDLLFEDAVVQKHFSKDELEKLFDLTYYLRYVDQIFENVFSK